MKKSLRLRMAVVLTVVFGTANSSAAQWYGYALYTSNGANWQNHFYLSLQPQTIRTL